jgi:predicted Zn-dependent protease with MMP-like domain
VPERFHLPSGAEAAVGGPGPDPPVRGLFAADAAGCRVTLTDGGLAIALRDLSLEDFHTLRAILRRLGLVAEPELELDCQNCGHQWWVRPSSALELGPYRDGELEDAELDEAFRFGNRHSVGFPPTTVELRPVTVGQVEPLHVALDGGGPLWPNRNLIHALGLGAIGEERDPARLARRLRRASDAFWEELGLLFESAHYPPRLTVPHACERCHAVEWVGIPVDREFTVHSAPARTPTRRGARVPRASSFPSSDEFEQLVRAAADRIYVELGARSVDLSVVEGPAECDDAGEPLLGAYYPEEPEALPPRPAEIRIFYGTFRNLWADQGPYEVGEEIEETLRHELAHHFGQIAGTDPLDAGERAEIASDYRRRVGRREAVRRAVKLASGDILGFWRGTWWVWILVSLVTLLLTWSEL